MCCRACFSDFFFYKKNKRGNVTGIHSSCFKLVVLLKNKKIKKKNNNDATKGLIVRELLILNHTSLGRYRSTADRDSRNSTAQQTPSGLLKTFTGIKLHQRWLISCLTKRNHYLPAQVQSLNRDIVFFCRLFANDLSIFVLGIKIFTEPHLYGSCALNRSVLVF